MNPVLPATTNQVLKSTQANRVLKAVHQWSATLGHCINRIEMNIESIASKENATKKRNHIYILLLKEVSQSSRDSFESESDSVDTIDFICPKVTFFTFASFS